MGVAFGGLSEDLGWRLMLGSTVVLPLIVCAQVYFCPESPRYVTCLSVCATRMLLTEPRWYIQHNRPEKAFRSFQRLRHCDLQAARDTYYTYVGVELERQALMGKNLFTQFVELFTIPRNRRAAWASWIVMFGQQVSLLIAGFLLPAMKTSSNIAMIVLWCKRHCVLQYHHLYRVRILHNGRIVGIHGYRNFELGIRSARRFHH